MTEHQAWLDLLEQVKQGVTQGGSQPKWQPPNKLVIADKWAVQARFVKEPGKYSIFFERFGAEIGDQNVDLPPGTRGPTSAWTMLFEMKSDKAFWRFCDGGTLGSEDIAKRVVGHLFEFQERYKTSMF